ncbi:transcriptional regulator FilR1 domain-containing protein [Halorubellus sp. PRR65]|uniref:helix-turn-helix transcriptional regulator n=1 Tax=Halorubellus sp. PRR65 TaxID=3098148 RepID=UPI002B25AF87|nr:transcriptional regulator FilR1 domain-containing protein [Halorubellus sp. PRR65]
MGVFDAVFTSSVRRTVLAELGERPRQRRDLLDDVDASKSAVYDALNELRDRDLLREGRSRRWETTGLGDLVADYVAARERTGEVLSTHADFWATHDGTALPEPFRASLGALAGAERLDSPDAEPFRVVGRVVDVVERADRAALATPVYHDRYAAALERAASNAEVRLVLAQSVLDEVEERADADWGAVDPDVRVADPGVTVLVTDESVLLALPREDGTHDLEAMLLADTDRAREWAERVFEAYWRAATPLGEPEPAARH